MFFLPVECNGLILVLSRVHCPVRKSIVSFVRIFLVWDDQEGKAPSTIKLKAYAAKNLPPYMIPDRFLYLPELPQTSTDKTDYQKLAALV